MHKKSFNIREELYSGLKENSQKGYETTIRKYEKFHNLTIEELVCEALDEQSRLVPEHELSIYNRVMDFQKYCIANYKYNTVKLDVNRIKTIYRRNRVTLPYFPPLDSKQCKHNPYIDYFEILTKEEIKLALNYLTPNMKARVMLMATGGYSLEETRTLTVRKFLEELYPYHQCDDANEAMKTLSKKDNIVWVSKMVRVKTQKPYYGMCNPETVQQIAKSWINQDITDIDVPLFRQTKLHVSKHLGDVNDICGLGKAGGFRRFTPHSLRRYNATNLSGADLSYEEEVKIRMIDELQGRSMTSTQERYIKINPLKQKLLYVKAMNNVSLYNQYEYELHNGEVIIHRVDPQKKVKNLKVENQKLTEELEVFKKNEKDLEKMIKVMGKETFTSQLSKLLSEL